MPEDNPAAQLADQIAGNFDLDRLPDLTAMMNATPQARRLYFAEAIRCLGSRRCFYDRDTKTMEFEPDGNARMKAVVWLSSYDVGMPLQRILQKTIIGNGDAIRDLADLLAQAPPTQLAAIERAIEQAKRKGEPKTVEAAAGKR